MASTSGAVRYNPDRPNVLEIDPLMLQRPSRSMGANWIACTSDGENVDLIFGHKVPGREQLAAAFLVTMSRERFTRGLCQTKFVAGLREHGGTFRMSDPVVDAVADGVLGERFVFDRANILAAAYADGDAELRFYQASPGAIEQMRRRSNTIDDEFISPVVEISMHARALLGLVERACILKGDDDVDD